jgi:peroxiredoxin
MKTLKLLFAVCALFVINNAFAQSAHLTLSDAYPQAGEKLTLSYNTAGSPLEGKTAAAAIIYWLDGKTYPAVAVDFKANGKLLTADVQVPDSAQAFAVKMTSPDSIDNNAGKGYVYMVYKGETPVPGAYASLAYVNVVYRNLGIDKSDMDAAVADLDKEFALYPTGKTKYKSNYFLYPAYSKSSANKILAMRIVDSLEKSSDEKDNYAAADMLYRMRKGDKGDSLIAVMKVKFPNGIAARQQRENDILKEKDVTKKDSLFAVYLKAGAAKDAAFLDYVTANVAVANLREARFDKFYYYKAMLKDSTILADFLNDVPYNWAKAGVHLQEAELLAKEGLLMDQYKTDHATAGSFATAEQVKRSYQSSWDYAADSYAYILYKEAKYDEALKVEKPVWERNKDEADIAENYADILVATKNYAQATDIIETSIKSGKETDGLKSALKTCYLKNKGSENGYAEYLAILENASKEAARAELIKQMINQPAPVFTLKDVNGNVVSLSDLKGKTVIVDFWATWCGPCKASMPGMQMAVNKYKDDPNTVFLFIDTWENGDKYLDGVKKFIADNNYTFHVVMDETGNDGRQSKVVTRFNVEGIPTKFIIDKNGNIRFKIIGYDGTPQALVDEVSAMIDLTANPPGSFN